ncbi:MAG: ATP-binding protein, partial [Candidatus Methylomirabilales bacterium]
MALAVMMFGLVYLSLLAFTSLLHPYRFPIPYAVPIFDTPFVLVAIGVGYLCLERHRFRQDSRSAFLGTSLWLAALLGLSHILTQPDYPGTPGVHAGVAPYFLLLSFLVGFAGIGLAVHYGERQLPLSDRARIWIGVAIFFLSILVVLTVIRLRPVLPSLVMPPGRLTPFAIGVAGVSNGLIGVWAFWGGKQKFFGKTQDWFAGYLTLAALIWMLGLMGFLIFPFRYGVSWYMAGLTRPIGVTVIFIALIWEQVVLYREARARQRDLEVLHAELQANLERLKETQAQLIQADKLKALGTLLSGMAHELNNPLSSILLSVQRQKQQYDLPDQARKRLDVIEQQAERASEIIRDLLVFARRKPPERKRVNLNDVVKAPLALQAPDFDLNNIRVVSDLEPALLEIWGDGHQLQQVFLNLFTNAAYAMKSTHARGTLTVRSFRRGSKVFVEVDDDGPGIPPDDIGRIFDPFFTTRGAGEGTGLGLSLSFGIVEAHGGHMHAENLPGSGARFTVRLPLGEGAKLVEPPTPEDLAPSGRARILIVDDEKDLRGILAELIGDLGHQVEEAATGQEAITSLERQVYD